jgi:hypothetical protein
MKTNTLLLLQSILIVLQVINAGLAEVLPSTPVAHFIALCSAAILGGFQFYVQHLGNQATPEQKLP